MSGINDDIGNRKCGNITASTFFSRLHSVWDDVISTLNLRNFDRWVTAYQSGYQKLPARF